MKARVLLAATAMDRMGILTAALAARRRGWWWNAGLTVFVYHRVLDPADIGDLDPEFVDATLDEFDEQMAYVRRHFRPLAIEDVLAAHRAGRGVPPGSALVTFDDGYRDNCERALPILLKHRIPALFFVSTDYVKDRRMYWWERISLLVRRSTRSSVQLEYPYRETFDLSTPLARAVTLRRLNRIVKDRFALDLDAFLSGLAAACGVTWTDAEDRAIADQALMSWKHVKTLREAGMGIGSHTCSHRVLQTLRPAELTTELVESRAELERQMGEPVTTLAFPVGKSIAHFQRVRQAVADAGYELAFTSNPGVNNLMPAEDPYDLKRLPIDRGVAPAVIRARMTFPLLTGWVL